mmetsp:Transcript_386/g.812  ORF Transcript_386/g.812 Transcript_386/m.812 type:complete len:113 (-) Transcript_386:98-436(-)
MKILDPSIRHLQIVQHFLDLRKECRPDVKNVLQQNLGLRSFGDFEGHSLVFGGLKHPFSRALCFHAHRARTLAVTNGWISQESDFEFQEFWSETDNKQKVLDWLEKSSTSSL